jgi:hypothetical protein
MRQSKKEQTPVPATRNGKRGRQGARCGRKWGTTDREDRGRRRGEAEEAARQTETSDDHIRPSPARDWAVKEG